MKNLFSRIFLVTLSLLAFSITSASAASLTLTKIGALDVGGKKLSGQWYYTSTNPTLFGTAGESAAVTIKIDDNEGSATADASGNWQYYSDKLTEGNHAIVITSGSESMSFSLMIGQDVPEGTSSASGVPVTGGSNITIYALIGAALLAGGAIMLVRRR